MTQHTPGPWHVRNNGPHPNNPKTINYDIAWSNAGELVAEHVYEESDARLIAAAPDLLEALERLVEFVAARDSTVYLVEQYAAIAKARGEVQS